MGQQHRDIGAVRQLQQLVQHPLAPRPERHLQQQDVRAGKAQAGQAVESGDALEEQDLRPQMYPGQRRRQMWPQLLPRPGAAGQKAVRPVLRCVEVGRGRHIGDTLRRQRGQHLKALLRAAAAVVHSRQDVTVQVNHDDFLPSADFLGSEGFRSPAGGAP